MKDIHGTGFRTKYGIARGFTRRHGKYDDTLFIEFQRKPIVGDNLEALVKKLQKKWRAVLKDGKDVPRTKKECSTELGNQWNKATLMMMIDALNRIANQVDIQEEK